MEVDLCMTSATDKEYILSIHLYGIFKYNFFMHTPHVQSIGSLILKGTVSRDYRPSGFFSSNNPPPGPMI
jgi:hypothetical protein